MSRALMIFSCDVGCEFGPLLVADALVLLRAAVEDAAGVGIALEPSAAALHSVPLMPQRGPTQLLSWLIRLVSDDCVE